MEEHISFKGHRNIMATHRSTLEITKDEHLTLRGDCIIGVSADKACHDLSPQFKERLKCSMVKVMLIVGEYEYGFNSYGDKYLRLEDKHEIVIRKSNYICARTLSIRSERASIDIPREMIQLLRDKDTKGIMILSTE